MPSKVKVFLFSIVTLVILSQYTNCDNYEDYESGLHFNSGLCFEKGSCANPSADKLQVNIDSEIVPPVSKLNSSVVITGSCSAGNYNRNNIEYSYGTANGNGDAGTGIIIDGCVNGKFLFTLLLNAANVAVGTVYDVEVKITGIDQSGRSVSSTRPAAKISFFK